MDKLLVINKKDFGDEHHYRMYRAQCDCLDAADAMDIDVESWGMDDEKKYITLRMDAPRDGFIGRIKLTWNVLLGKWSWREFNIRQEDLKDLSDIINPDKKYSELP